MKQQGDETVRMEVLVDDETEERLQVLAQEVGIAKRRFAGRILKICLSRYYELLRDAIQQDGSYEDALQENLGSKRELLLRIVHSGEIRIIGEGAP